MIENLHKENLFVIYKCISEYLNLSRLYMSNKGHYPDEEMKDLVKSSLNTIITLKKTNKFKFLDKYLEQSIFLRTIEVSTREEADLLRYLRYKLFEEYPSSSDFTSVSCIFTELKKILDKQTYQRKFLKDLSTSKENRLKNYGFKYFHKFYKSARSSSQDLPISLFERQKLSSNLVSIYDLFLIYLPEYHQLQKDSYDSIMSNDDIIPLSWKFYLAITVSNLI